MPPAPRKKKDPVDATIVGQKGPPVRADVVKNSTASWRNRFPIVALILVLMYFAIAGHIKTNQNADSIHDLTASQARLTTSQSELLSTVRRDEAYVILASQYIGDMRKALATANDRLKAAGLEPVKIPPPPTAPRVSSQARKTAEGQGGGASPQPTSMSSPRHSHPRHSPSPEPRPSHSPKPSPSPSPTQQPDPCDDLRYAATHPLQCLSPLERVLGAFWALLWHA